ncbi:MAG: PaaI family thioesterase [Geminicoccaceae bacterium]|nr:PaaI family thioesterase [Geminicoccaceae bacterium]
MQQFEPKNQEFARAVKDSFERQGLMHTLGIRLARVEPGLVELRVPFADRIAQQHGYFHGALIGAALDSAGGYAALTLMPAASEVLSTEYKINFVAAGRGEELIAEGRVIRPGRTITVTEARAWCASGGERTLSAVMLQSLIRIDA